MANNIIIRTAKQDYVCACCNHKISKGTEYLDKVVLNNGKCVQHERYHDECPKENKLLTMLFKNTDYIPVIHNYTKYFLIGMKLIDGARHAMICEWDNVEDIFYVTEEEFNKEWR